MKIDHYNVRVKISFDSLDKLINICSKNFLLKKTSTSFRFPLYCRNSFWSEPLQYAIYLLNQNIAQMKFHLSLHKIDLRTTLSNLLDLLNGPPPSAMVDLLDVQPVPSSISGSSVDFKVLIPVTQKEASPVSDRR